MNRVRWGSGPRPFLGLHGWGGDHQTFAPLVPHLPDDVSFWSVDLPGYGATPAPDSWQLEGLRADLATQIRELSESAGTAGTSVTVVGSCSGGIFAAEAATVVPERVARLALIDVFAWVPWYFGLFLRGEFGRRAYHTTFASALGRRLTNAALAGRRKEGTDLTASFVHVAPETALGTLRLLAEVGTPERFRGLPMAVDLAHGERTFGAVRAGLPAWRAALPQATVKEISGAGHLPIREETAQVARWLFRPEGAP